jgi:3-isopropylmalate dehydrogenase
MMLDWFGTDEEQTAAERIRAAVRAVFADPRQRTADIGGTLTTTQMTDALLRSL